MRITRLELKAVGPFTGCLLDLASGGVPGLHIIHGRNEAGKSSTLRALNAWLFGFPERTVDNFVHPNDQLLVGGCLRAEDGRELTFYRRKKRKADLLDQESNPLDPRALAAFLPISDQAVFGSLYGLTHEALVAGGEEMLAQKGEVGQALFAAGAGIGSLRAVLAGLDSEADGLFKPRGSTRELHQVLVEYQEAQKRVRQASLSGQEWRELSEGLAKAGEELAGLDGRRLELERERRQLERLRQLYPQLALRGELAGRLAGLAEVVVLPAGFGEERRQVEQRLHTLMRQAEELARRREELGVAMAGIAPPQQVLAAGDEIEALHQRLGEYNKALADRPRLEGMRIAARREAAALLRQFRPELSLEEAESLRPLLVGRRVIAGLAERHEGIQRGLEQVRKRRLTLEQEDGEAVAVLGGLPAPVSMDSLAEAIRLARRAGDLDGLVAEAARLATDKAAAGKQLLARQALWRGELAELPALALPLEDSLHVAGEQLAGLAEQRRELERERERAANRVAEVEAELARFAGAGEVPTEEELLRLRAERDQRWQALLACWQAGEQADWRGLAEEHQRLAAQADEVADRLRREADRVQVFVSRRAERHSIAAAMAALAGRLEELTGGQQAWEAGWRTLWADCRVEPRTPREMLSWLGLLEKARTLAEEAVRAEATRDAKEQERAELVARLRQELGQLGESAPENGGSLEPLLMYGEQVASRLAEQEEKRSRLLERRRDLANSIALVRLEQERLEDELTTWRQQWQEAAGGLVSGREARPAEATDLVALLQECFAKLDGAEELRRRIAGIDGDAKGFEEAVAALAMKLVPREAGEAASRLVGRLKALLAKAQADQTLLGQHAKAMAAAEEEARKTERAIDEGQARLAELCRQAGCADPTGLAEAERRSVERRSLEDRLAETEKALLEGAGGLSLAELSAQAAIFSPDTLPERIEALGRVLETEIEPRRLALTEQIALARERLARMDGGAMAGEAAEEAARLLARLRRLADRYVRLKLAGHVLKREIERYRAENQDPVLSLASGHFRDLTIGSFEGLRADENEQGEPVLVGVRPGGGRLSVERMSSGTRDQLYLALRLASLEWRLGGHEPMPLILDDILINFDDARTRATLSVLAGLAQKTQVILFTHHQAIVEAASSLAKDLPVSVLDLAALSAQGI
ncbi:MAG: AAA family ATPase [Thermodesulfobacteriota bacterium]